MPMNSDRATTGKTYEGVHKRDEDRRKPVNHNTDSNPHPKPNTT